MKEKIEDQDLRISMNYGVLLGYALSKGDFCPNFACVANCLHELILKRLSTALMLSYPIAGAAFIFDTGTRGYAIGAVLSQITDGQKKIVAF